MIRLEAETPSPIMRSMESSDRLRISTEVQVMYFDTDAAGVVNNIAYLRFIETTRTLLALQIGDEFRGKLRAQKFILWWCAPKSITRRLPCLERS